MELDGTRSMILFGFAVKRQSYFISLLYCSVVPCLAVLPYFLRVYLRCMELDLMYKFDFASQW